MKSNQLKPIELKRLGPGYHCDGAGLYLQVTERSRCWVFRYQFAGKTREMGLGGFPAIGLASARELAEKARVQVKEGDDPIAIRQAKRDAARAEALKKITFKECADGYHAAHADSWRSDHTRQWRETMTRYVHPVLGSLSVETIDLPHVLRVLEPIWGTKRVTAQRIRGRIENVLAWATVRGYRTGDNPARWKGHLDQLFPTADKPKHREALPLDQVPAFMAKLRGMDTTTAKALEFMILCASRSGEVLGAVWSEVKDGLWTIPANRMKSGVEHQVPLSSRAREILSQLPHDGDLVFPSRIGGGMITDAAVLQLVKRRAGANLTVHGFRSSFRDWCGDHTNFPRDVAEAALAHRVADKTERAYRRGAALEKRRQLMEAWSRYCSRPAIEAVGNVMPIQAIS
jgi:integrase